MRLPVGFAHDGADRVVLDPNQQVQQALRVFFETFRRVGSATATVREFRRLKLRFPRRVQHGARKGKILSGELGRIACRRRRALAAPGSEDRRPLEPEDSGDGACRQTVVVVRLRPVEGEWAAARFGLRKPRDAEPFVGKRMADLSLGLAGPKAGSGGSMSAAKEELTRIIAAQPEDSTQEELVRELALRLMVRRGLDDADAGRTISNEEMRSRIRAWPD